MARAFDGCSYLEIPASRHARFLGRDQHVPHVFQCQLGQPGHQRLGYVGGYEYESDVFGAYTAANPDTSGWDTSSVTDMFSMFASATAANPDTSGWNTSAVTDMSDMFAGATSANPDTSGWDTSAVTNMTQCFTGATRPTRTPAAGILRP